jgi:hypothetical protein
MITKEEAYKLFNTGWYNLLDIAYTTLEEVPFSKGIEKLNRRYGMLSVSFIKEGLTDTQKYILESVEYRIERQSVLICEMCGESGRRRKTLQEIQTLCIEHYALQYSIEYPAPSLVANSEPYTDY